MSKKKYAPVPWIAHEPVQINWYDYRGTPSIRIQCSCEKVKSGELRKTWTLYNRHAYKENFRVARQAMIEHESRTEVK